MEAKKSVLQRLEEEKLKSEDSAGLSYKGKSGNLKEILIPIIALIIFGIILYLGVFRQIQNISRTLDEKDTLLVELESKEAELAELRIPREQREINSDLLNRLETIIPTSQTEVVGFERRVTEFANQTNSDIQNVAAGERILIEENSSQVAVDDVDGAGSPQTSTENLRLVQIPLEFELTGNLDSFRQMLVNIYEGSDFIVITEMELNNENPEMAEMELVLSKYQFLPFSDEIQRREILNAVSYKERPNEQVIEFIRRKTDIDNSN